MSMHFAILLSAMAGVAVGAIGVQALQAQAKPPAFVIGEIEVRDSEVFAKEYPDRVRRPAAVASTSWAAAKASRSAASPRRIAIMAGGRPKPIFNSAAYKEAKAAGDKVATFVSTR